MATKHTPGPWVGQFDAEDWSVDGPLEGRSMTFEAIGAEGRDYPIAIAVQRDGRIIGSGDAELSANVALMAAAPTMLEALKALVALPIAEKQLEYLRLGIGTATPNRAWLDAVAAIAAAEAEAGR